MKMKRLFIHLLLILTFLGASFLIGLHDAPAQEDVVVVVNSGKPSLSSSQIKRIFTGDVTRWPGGGGMVKVLFNSNASISEDFAQKYLNMSKSRLDDLWVKKSIRDGVPTPRKVASNIVVTMVSNSPKFIGYVRSSEAGSSVKVLK